MAYTPTETMRVYCLLYDSLSRQKATVTANVISYISEVFIYGPKTSFITLIQFKKICTIEEIFSN